MRITLVIGLMFTSFSGISAQPAINDLCQIDSGKTNILTSPVNFDIHQSSSQPYSFINISGQLLVGFGLASGFAIIPVSFGVADAWHGSRYSPVLGILTLSSYLFGAAVGVHWIASYENPGLSFWETLGFSAIGGSAGALIISILAANYTTIPDIGVVAAALSPVLGSMAYVSFVSEREISSSMENHQHKDLYDLTKIINIELVRIKL